MSNDRVSFRAPAKINLYLKVTGRREDGYHNLATLLQKISLYDRIDIKKARSGIRLACPDSDLPEDESNLAYRAAAVFLQKVKDRLPEGWAGVDITLQKSIPLAAGLGGGSSDAATVLKGLDFLFSAGCSEKELIDMAAALGADVPFFVASLPAAWGTGIGDLLEPVPPLSGYCILLVNPGYSVSTPWVYENFALTVEKKNNNLNNFQIPDKNSGPDYMFLRRAIKPDEVFNDLEKVTASHYQEINLLKKRLLNDGAAAALMSGSGPTVFGLFHASEARKAADCEELIKREYPKTFLVEPLQS